MIILTSLNYMMTNMILGIILMFFYVIMIFVLYESGR